MKCNLFCLFIAVLIGFSFSSASAQGKNSIVMLNEALAKGQIDYQEALNRKINAIFRQKALRLAYQSPIPIKSATFTLKEAADQAHLLDPENRFVLYRPTDYGDDDYYGLGTVVWTYESAHFAIHYTEDNSYGDAVPGSDGVEETLPWYVTAFAGYFEEIRAYIVNRRDYLSPPPDGLRGGNGKFDVYIINMHAYGYCAIDEGGCPYIVVENDYAGFPINLDPEGRQKGTMKITAAHEFFHAVQYQYRPWSEDNIWWYENTAVWMEDEIFDEADDYLNFVGLLYDDENDNSRWDSGEVYYNIDGTVAGTSGRPQRWSDRPKFPLDTFNGAYEYGGVVWAKYLSEKYGSRIIKDVLERMPLQDGALEAIATELQSRGDSLHDALKDFRLKNLLQYYEEGDFYPLPRHSSTIVSYPATISPSSIGLVPPPPFPPSLVAGLRHLASEYIAFKPGTIESVTFTVRLSGQDVADFSMLAVKWLKSGGIEAEEIGVDPLTSEGSLDVPDFAENYDKIVLIPLNLSETNDRLSWTISAQGSGGSVPQPTESALLFPHVVGEQGWWTGIALLNSGNLTEVTVFLYDRRAHLLSSTNFALQPWEKKAVLVGDLFSGITIPNNSWLKVVSSNIAPLYGFEVWGTDDGLQLSGLKAVDLNNSVNHKLFLGSRLSVTDSRNYN